MKISKIYLFILLFVSASNILYAEEKLDIDFAYYRKVHKLDNGTIHLFVKNTGNKDAVIKKVFLNDKLLSLKKCPNDEVLWFQIIPNPIKPKKIANVMIKLARPTQKLMKVEVKTKRNTILKRVIQPVTPKIEITNISFDEDFRIVYVYIQNNSENNLRLKRLFLDTKDVTSKLENKEYIVEPGKKHLYIIKLNKSRTSLPRTSLEVRDKPLHQGEYMSIKAVFDEDKIMESVVRVFSVFPVSSWDADTRESLNFDPYPFRFTIYKGRYTNIPEKNPTPLVHLMDHPNCKDGHAGAILGTHATKVVKRQKKSIKKYPSWPTLIYGCEYSKPRAYFVYGEITDAFLVNPYEIIFHNGSPERNGYFASLGKLACQPKPLFSSPAAFSQKPLNGKDRFLTSEELRKTVFYELGNGSKGIIYFNKEFNGGKGYSENKDLENEIRQINWVLQQLKPYLTIGEPMELASSKDKNINLYSILAGDKAIVLFLINKEEDEKEKVTPIRSSLSNGVNIKLDIPFGLKVKQVYQINQFKEEIKPYPYRYLSQSNRISLEMEKRESVMIFLLSLNGFYERPN